LFSSEALRKNFRMKVYFPKFNFYAILRRRLLQYKYQEKNPNKFSRFEVLKSAIIKEVQHIF